MSGSVNRVILVGRLGRDPEVKRTPSGKAVANFSVATDEVFKDHAGEQQKRTEWHRIVAWGRLAEIVEQYVTKGTQVYVEGSIRSRKYEGRDGTEKTVYEIVAQKMTMLGGGQRRESGGETTVAPPASAEGQPVTPESPVTDDDIPF